jgi:hypothetical protein
MMGSSLPLARLLWRLGLLRRSVRMIPLSRLMRLMLRSRRRNGVLAVFFGLLGR